MRTLQVGGCVNYVQFLGDSRRLLTVAGGPGEPVMEVWTLATGERVRVDCHGLPQYKSDLILAAHPTGDWFCLTLRGRVSAFRSGDGEPLPLWEAAEANALAFTPDGSALLAAEREGTGTVVRTVTATADGLGPVTAERPLPVPCRLLGCRGDDLLFLEDAKRLTVRRAADLRLLDSARYRARSARHPQISPDGKWFAAMSHSNFYLYPLDPVGEPTVYNTGRATEKFVTFAFASDGRSLAMVHRAYTRVKFFTLEPFRMVRELRFKVGPIGCLAFSPDGVLGAAVGDNGQVAFWDIDD